MVATGPDHLRVWAMKNGVQSMQSIARLLPLPQHAFPKHPATCLALVDDSFLYIDAVVSNPGLVAVRADWTNGRYRFAAHHVPRSG